MALVSQVRFTDLDSYVLNTVQMYQEYAPRAPEPAWWPGFEEWVDGVQTVLHDFPEAVGPQERLRYLYKLLPLARDTHWHRAAALEYRILTAAQQPVLVAGQLPEWTTLARLETIPGSGWYWTFEDED